MESQLNIGIVSHDFVDNKSISICVHIMFVSSDNSSSHIALGGHISTLLLSEILLLTYS